MFSKHFCRCGWWPSPHCNRQCFDTKGCRTCWHSSISVWSHQQTWLHSAQYEVICCWYVHIFICSYICSVNMFFQVLTFQLFVCQNLLQRSYPLMGLCTRSLREETFRCTVSLLAHHDHISHGEKELAFLKGHYCVKWTFFELYHVYCDPLIKNIP